MSDNDLIKRGDVLKEAVYLNVDTNEMVVFVQDIKKIPAVPQEMTARELFAARDRMCNSNYNGGHMTPACKTCPLWRDNNGYYMYCGTLMTMRPLDFLAIVEKWAREHPETDMMTAKYALPKIDFEEGAKNEDRIY